MMYSLYTAGDSRGSAPTTRRAARGPRCVALAMPAMNHRSGSRSRDDHGHVFKYTSRSKRFSAWLNIHTLSYEGVP